MSASKEKQVRVEQRNAGTDKKRNAADEELLKAKKFRRNAIIAVVCIVLVVAAALVINSNLFYTGLTAVKVGDTSYSAAEVDVFYRNTYNTVYSNYGSLASYVFDTSKPLTEQSYDENQSWADFLYSQTLENMRQVTMLCDEAAANGFTLTDEQKGEIDAQLETMAETAAQNSFPNVDRFLAALYGKGVDSAVFRSVMTKIYTAAEYSASVRNSFTYDQAKLDSYYEEHKNELDTISFYSYFVGSDNEAFASLGDDTVKLDAAREAARVIARAEDPEELRERIDEFSAGAEPTEQTNVAGSQVSAYYSDYSDWLLDSARKEYDTTVAETDSGAYVVMFVNRDDNDYLTKSMRHILINEEEDADGEYTDATSEIAHAKIAQIHEDWDKNPTEDYFAELANEKSEDTGSNTTGGLYENITKGQMVPNIDEFLFDPDRESGEVEELYGQSSAYQGWHLVYFVGDGENHRNSLAENGLRDQDYQAWQDARIEKYTTTPGSGARYVKLT